MGIFQFISNNIQEKQLDREYDFSYIHGELSLTSKINLVSEFNKIIQTISEFTASTDNSPQKDVILKLLQDKIIKMLNSNPNLLRIQTVGEGFNTSIAAYALQKNLHDIVRYALNDYRAPIMQNKDGDNLGMLCAQKGLEDFAIIALDNTTARRQQNKWGYNIGMICANRGMPNATQLALTDEVAATQQNRDGDNIGMLFADQYNPGAITNYDNHHSKALEIILLALANKEARQQINKRGQSIYCIAHKNIHSQRKLLEEKYTSLYSQDEIDDADRRMNESLGM